MNQIKPKPDHKIRPIMRLELRLEISLPFFVPSLLFSTPIQPTLNSFPNEFVSARPLQFQFQPQPQLEPQLKQLLSSWLRVGWVASIPVQPQIRPLFGAHFCTLHSCDLPTKHDTQRSHYATSKETKNVPQRDSKLCLKTQNGCRATALTPSTRQACRQLSISKNAEFKFNQFSPPKCRIIARFLAAVSLTKPFLYLEIS